MAVRNINTCTITGNLTRDPEMRATPGGLAIATLSVAVNGSEKVNGEWTERPDYFDVTVFGGSADACGKYLSKGRPVAVTGRMRQDRWDDKETGKGRSKVKIVADVVQFLGSKDDNQRTSSEPQTDVPVDDPAFAPATAGTTDAADIPFLWEPYDYDMRYRHDR